MRRHLVLAALALLATACGGGGGGGGGPTVYYVRSSGSDLNGGSSPADAFATLQAAVDKAGSGDTIIVGPGVYTVSNPADEALLEIFGKSASAGSALLLRADNGSGTGDAPGEVLLDAQDRGFGIRVTSSAHVIIDGFVIRGARGANGAGVQIRTQSAFIEVRNCELTENIDGIRVESSDDTLIFNNLIQGNVNRGVQISGDSRRTAVINNTVAFNQNDGISSADAASGTRLRNDLVYENGARGIDIDRTATAGYDADYNLIFPTERNGISIDYGPDTPKGLNDVSLDPLLVPRFLLAHESAGDPQTSPAVDAGDPVTDLSLTDALRRRTTASDDELDAGVVDIGFHFPSSKQPEPTPTPNMQVTPSVGPTSPPAARLYVRANGSDGDGKSPAAAFRTLQKAADSVGPGTEVIVGPGTYSEEVHFLTPGLADRRIVFRADPTGAETGDGAGPVIVNGQTLHRGFFVDGARFNTFDGFVLSDTADAAIHVRRQAEQVIIRNCEIYAGRGDGIRIQDSPRVTMLNNLIYCNGRRGIVVVGSTGSDAAQIVNNTVVANRDRGVFIGTSTAASPNAFLRDNILQDNCGSNLQLADNSHDGYDARYNLVSPPTYNGAPIDETDTAFDPNGPMNVPAGFVSRALCEGLCPAPQPIPPSPTPRPTPRPLPDPPNYSITRSATDFRLRQTLAGDPPPDGVGVDRGDPSLGREFTELLRGRTTATNGVADGGQIDMGYHFRR